MFMQKSLARIQGKEEGFTLVELLIVVAIIAILAAIAIPQFAAYRKRGYAATLNSDAKNAFTAAQALLADNPNIAAPVGGAACAALLTAGYTASAGTTCVSTLDYTTNPATGTVAITGTAGWGLTTNVATINFNGVIVPAMP